MLLNCLLVGLGGFFGAALRYGVGFLQVKEATQFPIKTFLINLLGCFAIGIIAAIAAKNERLDTKLLLFLKVGLCGGFTTFSSFALESSELLQSGHAGLALAYVLGSTILGVGLVLAAQIVFR